MSKQKLIEELYNLMCICRESTEKANNVNKQIQSKLGYVCTNVNKTVECDIYRYLGNNITPIKKEVIKNVLTTVFGDDCYKQEQMLKTISEGISNLTYNGVNIDYPKSVLELVDILIIFGEIANNKLYNAKVRTKCIVAIKKIQDAIARKQYKINENIKETDFAIQKFNEIISSYKLKKPIKLVDKEKFYIVIDHGLYVTINNEENNSTEKSDEPLSYFVEDFIELYNESLVKTDDEIVEKKADKYFKKLSKMPKEKIEYKNFPKYSNNKFKEIMEILLCKFTEAQEFELVVASTIHYANFYKDGNLKKETCK